MSTSCEHGHLAHQHPQVSQAKVCTVCDLLTFFFLTFMEISTIPCFLQYTYIKRVGMTQEQSTILLNTMLVSEGSSTDSFGTQRLIFEFWGAFNCQWSWTTHFLSHTFEDPSCRICSNGPHDHFGFRSNFYLIWKIITKKGGGGGGSSHFSR